MYEKLKFQENKYILLNHLQVRRVFVHGCGAFSFRNTAVLHIQQLFTYDTKSGCRKIT